MGNLIRKTSYFPWKWIPQDDFLVWVDLPHPVARKVAFLDMNLNVSGLEQHVEPWPTDLRSLQSDCCFLTHSSLCGSTLLAKTLDGLGGGWVLREPWLLRQLADWRRGFIGEASYSPAPELVQARVTKVLRLLQNYCGSFPVTIKATNLANLLILEQLNAGFSSHILVLTGPLREFLGMVLKRGDTLAKMPVLARNLICRSPAQSEHGLVAELTDWLHHDGNADPLLCAGLVWLLHMIEFDGLRRAAVSASQVKTLLTSQLLSEPQESCIRSAEHLGIDAERDTIRAKVEGPTWHTHAKHPEFQFSPTARTIILERMVHNYGQQVERVERCVRMWLKALPDLYLPPELSLHNRVLPVNGLAETE